MSNSKYYKTCLTCDKSFSVRYFPRHECQHQLRYNDIQVELDSTDNSLSEGNNEILGNAHDVDMVNEIDESDDAYFNVDQDHINDNSNINDDEGNFPEDLFEELLNESFWTNDNTFDLQNSKHIQLLKWLCLFLALWQKTFNITDSALQFLLKFFALFFKVFLNENWDNVAKSTFTETFPETLYSFRKYLSIDRNTFTQYVVCLKCHCLYNKDDCIETHAGTTSSKVCQYIQFPNHPQKQHRKKCGQLLMRPIKSISGRIFFHPIKTYCYRPVKESLKILLQRPDFEENCEKWRSQNIQDDLLADVFDGEIWKTFQKNNQLFFSSERNYGLMLNCDWFQPFKHLSSFSIGAIYIVLLNLPRYLRFKRQNIFLVGIIPDMPKEPPTNSFLEPLVQELNVAFYEGFLLDSLVTAKKELYYLALICVGCDIPASRKLCGFLGHSASRGCSKCNKLFPGAIGERNYGGFNIDEWEERTVETHQDQMIEIASTNTATSRNKLESEYGTRFSVLALLPYFNTVRMTIVDPMHNLFLGSAKHICKIWKEKGYLNKANLQLIQDRTDSFIVPHELGKIPRKIISSFDGFNADEYKNWTLLFSLYALRGIIPSKDRDCFRKFVLACQFLCKKIISKNDVVVAHQLLLQFCRNFEILYGEDRVTPNIHLHMHLKKCVLDFGPIYSFWLFSFERYNGMLGNLPNNKKNIEPQIMRRFCTENILTNLEQPEEFREQFNDIFLKLETSDAPRGTLRDIESRNMVEFAKLASRLTNPVNQLWHAYNEFIQPLKAVTISRFSRYELEKLKMVYTHLYPNLDFSNAIFPESYEKCMDIIALDNRYSSSSSRNKSSSYITAFWTDLNGQIAKFEEIGLLPHPGIIRYLFKHSLIIQDKAYIHWFASCEWFQPVSEDLKNKFGKPLELWYRSLYLQYGSSTFIPVYRILSKFVHAPLDYRSKELMVVVPRTKYSTF